MIQYNIALFIFTLYCIGLTCNIKFHVETAEKKHFESLNAITFNELTLFYIDAKNGTKTKSMRQMLSKLSKDDLVENVSTFKNVQLAFNSYPNIEGRCKEDGQENYLDFCSIEFPSEIRFDYDTMSFKYEFSMRENSRSISSISFNTVGSDVSFSPSPILRKRPASDSDKIELSKKRMIADAPETESNNSVSLCLQNDFINDWANSSEIELEEQFCSIENKIKKLRTDTNTFISSKTNEIKLAHEEKNIAIRERNAAIKDKEDAICERNAAIKDKEDAICERNAAIKDKEDAICEKNAAIKDKEDAICEKNAAIKDKEDAIREKNAAIKDKEDAICEKNVALHEKETALRKLEVALHEKETALRVALDDIDELRRITSQINSVLNTKK